MSNTLFDAEIKKEDLPNINMEQYNKEIDEAMTRIDNGCFTSHEDVEKEMELW